MGDILLTVPALRAMAANDVEVHLVINSRWQALTNFLPACIHLFKGTGSMINLGKELKSLNPRALFDLQGKISTIALRTIIGAPITRVYQKRSLNEQFQAISRQYPLRLFDQRPVWQKYAEVCGVDVSDPDPSLNISESYLDECKKVLQATGLEENKFVLIHPEASKPGKELTQALISQLQKDSPLRLALIGTKNSSIQVDQPHLDLRNHFDLYHLPGILKLAKAVISSDSGPMHLARAVGTPLVAIFLQTCPSLGFAPVTGGNSLIISRDLPCKPCSLHGQNDSCPEGHFACRDLDPGITSTQVLNFLAPFL